jgi:hypothetical protein
METLEHGRIGSAATTRKHDVQPPNVRPLAVAVFRNHAGDRAAIVSDQVDSPSLGEHADSAGLHVLVEQGLHHVQDGCPVGRTPLVAWNQIGIVTRPGDRLILGNSKPVLGKPIDGGSAMVDPESHQHRVGGIVADAHDVVIVRIWRVLDPLCLLKHCLGSSDHSPRHEQRSTDDGCLFDHGHPSAPLGSEDRRWHARGTSTDDDEIESLLCKSLPKTPRQRC